MYNGTLDIYLQPISSAYNGNSAIFWVICGVYSHCCVTLYTAVTTGGSLTWPPGTHITRRVAFAAHKGIMLAESTHVGRDFVT